MSQYRLNALIERHQQVVLISFGLKWVALDIPEQTNIWCTGDDLERNNKNFIWDELIYKHAHQVES